MKRRAERTKITGTDPEDVSKKAEIFLTDALRRMLARDERFGPFIVVIDCETERFVQYCGSVTRPLRFEAPVIGLVEHHAPGDLLASSKRALQVLEFQATAPGALSAGVTVLEEDTFEPKRESESN